MAPLIALLAAAVATFVFDLGVAFARDWRPSLVYAAACGALSVGSAFGVAALLGWTRRTEIALAAWVGLSIYAGVMLYAGESWPLIFGLSAITWAALLLNPHRNSRPLGAGLGVAVTIAACAVILPRLFSVLGLPTPVDLAYRWTLTASFTAVLVAHSLYARFHSRVSWLPTETPLSLLALVALVLPIPLAMSGTPPQSQIEPFAVRGASASGLAPSPSLEDSELPHVIVLVLDTVRADRLSIYGYERDTTPELRAFVERNERAVVYPMAFSPSNWTLPAHASLFTGLLPSSHGAHSGRLLDLRHQLSDDQKLDAPSTMAESFRSRGYRTAAILANAQVMFFHGMERGFDQVVRPPAPGWLSLMGEKLRIRFVPQWLAHLRMPYPNAATISEQILSYLDDCGTAPCFVVGNYMEAHWPYAARPPYRSTFSGSDGTPHPPDLYDEELLGLDAALGDLLRELESRGVLDRAWLVITADHGEALGDHGAMFHGEKVYNPEVRIPLIVQPPLGESVAGRDWAVSTLDVSATLTAAAGAGQIGSGRDLRKLEGPQPVAIEFYGAPSTNIADRVSARAVVVDRAKLIDSAGRREFFQLDSDPHEKREVAARFPAEVEALTALLPPLTAAAAVPESQTPELSLEDVERLRELGYTD